MNDKLINKFSHYRKQFSHVGQVSYFNSAAYCPFCDPVKEAIEENLALRAAGDRDESRLVRATQDALRGDFARLIGARKREIGLGLSTSQGLNIAAFGLPLGKSDEVLLSDVEFPALVYIWRAAAEAKGFKIKLLPSKDRCFDIEALEKAITKKTRVLALSSVQFFNGFKNDLARISEICKANGVWLIVDGIQGMGVEPINVRKLGIDIFASGCQKWMLSPQGCGFFYVSDEIRDRISHPFMSWLGVDWKGEYTDLFRYDLPWFDSSRRFELGYYASLNILGMKAAVEIFKDLGIANIRRHNHTLIDRLACYIKSNPFYRISCSMEPRHRSSIFTFTCPRVAELHRILLKKRIILVRREGSIRVSVHLFNSEEDIDRLIAVLDRFSTGGADNN